MAATETELAVRRLLSAIESRDLRALAATLSPDARWQNVPHPPAVGRDAVIELLGGILTWSDEVRWDVVSAAFGGDVAWVERVDRFWIGGDEHAVRCNGVFETDDGVVTGVRDYVDLGEWRARISSVYAVMASRPVEAVVRRHLAAVEALDATAMAADYALDAVIVRAGREHRGWRAIGAYFASVPERLGDRRVSFGPIGPVDDDRVTVSWSILDGEPPVISGSDTLTVRDGRIVHQTVELEGDDF